MMKIPVSALPLVLLAALVVSCGEPPEPETPGTPGKLPPPESPDTPDPQAGGAKAPVPAPLPPGESRYKPRGLAGPQAGKGSRDVTGETGGTEESSKEFHTVEVFYGTNRKPTGFREPNEFYGRERNREGPVTYGRIDVSIPLHHTVGVVERPKWYKLEFSEDPKKHVVMVKLETLEKDDFFAKVGDKAKTFPKHEALLFVHGFNVSFPDAIRRTAQIAYDLDFQGTALAFSWPSQAALEAYTIDQDNAIWSAPHLSRFLLDLQEHSDLEEIHIIAHSMGTRVLTQALALAHDEGFSLKLNNVILAAPDIDADVFKDQILPKIKDSASRLTMYSSSGDTALKISQKIHGNDRLGLGGEFLKKLDGMDTINATDIDTSLLGHAYYGSHRVVVKDLVDLVVHHLDPPHRDLVQGALGEWDFKFLKEEADAADKPEETPQESAPDPPKAPAKTKP